MEVPLLLAGMGKAGLLGAAMLAAAPHADVVAGAALPLDSAASPMEAPFNVHVPPAAAPFQSVASPEQEAAVTHAIGQIMPSFGVDLPAIKDMIQSSAEVIKSAAGALAKTASPA
mmetsp:Transcript_107998/g.262358  ORF Transcript_107998/g.262358 Transcript_107998/m.262358 type:complete len:115 (-) Transcript_107998:131-475(-)